MTLVDIWKKIQKDGPNAVMLNRQGDIMMTSQAVQRNPDLHWDLIYIRNDGWSLGCEFYYAEPAENLHAGKWIAVVRRGDRQPKLMKQTDPPINASVG